MLHNVRVTVLFIMALLSDMAVGQETATKIDSTTMTSSEISTENEFIQDYKLRLNVKLEVGNDLTDFRFIEDGLENDLKLRANLNTRFAFVFSYKFLSVRIGFRPPISNDEEAKKGSTDTFRFRLQLLLENWAHRFEFNSDKGFYIENSGEFIPTSGGYKIQLPEMRYRLFSGTSQYRFNKNYSVRAVESQTEAQKKSAGSIMAGLIYRFYTLDGTERVRYNEDEIEERPVYNEYQGATLGATVGYYHTFVLKNYWYLNASIAPSAGIDLYTRDQFIYDTRTEKKFSEGFLALAYGVNLGYNSTKIFFGVRYNNRFSDSKFSDSNLEIQAQNHVYNVFFGYRFKAPKTVSAPVDMIEEKVPILKDDNKR